VPGGPLLEWIWSGGEITTNVIRSGGGAEVAGKAAKTWYKKSVEKAAPQEVMALSGVKERWTRS